MFIWREYERLLKEGILQANHSQKVLVEKFCGLSEAIENNKPHFNLGLYIFGDVGTGKTHLMDLFFKGCNIESKKRLHFSKFMLEIHEELHKIGRQRNPLSKLKFPYRLLCLDELQVTNVADGIILRGILRELFEHRKSFFVSTSNKLPEELEPNNHILSQLIRKHLDVFELQSDKDFRRNTPKLNSKFVFPINNATRKELLENFTQISFKMISLNVHGDRGIMFRATNNIACLYWEEDVCQQYMANAEFHAIAQSFKMVILLGVPRFTRHDVEGARRFMTLIDIFYDNKVTLHMQSEVHFERLFDWNPQDPYLREEYFALRRILSRLHEMQ